MKRMITMGESKRRVQAQKTEEYAHQNEMSISLALRRVRAFERAKQLMKTASKCPCCKKHSLYIDSSDSEYTIESWVSCSECDYHSSLTKKHMPLDAMFDFDYIVYLMDDSNEGLEVSADQWEVFVEKDTVDLEIEYGIRV